MVGVAFLILGYTHTKVSEFCTTGHREGRGKKSERGRGSLKGVTSRKKQEEEKEERK